MGLQLLEMADEVSKIVFLANEPYFSKINKYSFWGARISYGAPVAKVLHVSKYVGDWQQSNNFMNILEDGNNAGISIPNL